MQYQKVIFYQNKTSVAKIYVDLNVNSWKIWPMNESANNTKSYACWMRQSCSHTTFSMLVGKTLIEIEHQTIRHANNHDYLFIAYKGSTRTLRLAFRMRPFTIDREPSTYCLKFLSYLLRHPVRRDRALQSWKF